ncbi:hypothetical protein, partial [Actinocrispum sp. NPDC049592]|uniref:hypothetical protein n=1 Tax=Actinocrispum sp. NPDC049592 TaxID=3154835 RepID=UPI0034286023
PGQARGPVRHAARSGTRPGQARGPVRHAARSGTRPGQARGPVRRAARFAGHSSAHVAALRGAQLGHTAKLDRPVPDREY